MSRVAINGARNEMNTDINRSWQMSGFGLSRLGQVKGKIAEPGPYDLLVRTKAVSLNYKDKMIVEGTLIPDLAFPFVPMSDAVGEVVATGSGVSRFRRGQRVLGQVIADWPDGDAPPVLHKHTLGSSLSGMLSDHVVFGEDAAVLAPPSLSDIEAATLPIACRSMQVPSVGPGSCWRRTRSRTTMLSRPSEASGVTSVTMAVA